MLACTLVQREGGTIIISGLVLVTKAPRCYAKKDRIIMYKRHTQYRTCRSLCFLLKSSSPFSFHMLPFPQNVDPRTGDMLKDTSRSYHMCLTTKPHLTVCFSWICQCKRKLNHGPLCSLASFRIDRHASIRCCFHLRSGNVHECQRSHQGYHYYCQNHME